MAPDDPTPTRWIDRRDYLKLSGALAAGSSFGLAGCTGDGAGGDGGGDGTTATGYLSTSVTDQPTDIGDFESCVVTLDGVWLGPRSDGTEGGDEEESDDGDDEETDGDTDGENGTTAQSTSASLASGSQPDDDPGGQGGDGNETDGGDDTEDADEEDGDEEDGEQDGDGGEDDGNGRTYYAFEEPQEADLVELQGDNTQLIDDREVPVGTYQYLQLDVAGIEGVLADGGEATVETPGNAPLKFQESFDVKEGYRTSFTADFAPVKRGDGSYVIKPVASGTEVTYESVDGSGSETSDDGDETDGGSDEETSDDGDDSTNDTATGGNETMNSSG